MSTAQRKWTLLTFALAGAGIGQWVWLDKRWPFVVGLWSYIVAVISWLKLTHSFKRRPAFRPTTRLAWIGGAVFGALALLAGLRSPESVPIALILVISALAYVAWAVRHGRVGNATRRQMNERWTALVHSDPFCSRTHAMLRDLKDWGKTDPIRVVLISGSLLNVVGAALAAHRGVRPNANLVSLSAWGLGLVLFVAASIPPNAFTRLLAWVRTLLTEHRSEIAFVLALWGLAAVLRAINLDRIPTILTGDEGAMGLEAVKVLKGEQVNPFATGWTSHPNLYFYNLAFFLGVVGQKITALRLASALAGALTIPGTYLLARRSFDRRVASISALFLTGYHVHIHYSRLALNNVWAPLAAVLTLLCLWEGLQTRQTWLCALGGIAMGLGQYTYFGARLLPLVVAAWLLYLGLADTTTDPNDGSEKPSNQNQPLALIGNRWCLAVFWLAFLLAVLPLSWFFLEHWNDFTARAAQVGVFGSQGADPAREGYIAPLASGFFDSFMAFNYVNDHSIFYGPRLPLLHWFSGIAFVFGVIQAIVRWRERGNALLLIWLLGTAIFGGALMNHPPESTRLLFAAPAVAVLVALGLTQLGDQMARLSGTTSREHPQPDSRKSFVLALTATLAATCISAFYYFGVYTPSQQFGDLRTRTAHHLGIWARELEPSHQVYFFGAPQVTYIGFPSIPFLAPRARIQDVIEPIENSPPVESDSTFVFVPQRADELAIIAAAHPDGRRWEMSDDQGRLLFVAYEVKRET